MRTLLDDNVIEKVGESNRYLWFISIGDDGRHSLTLEDIENLEDQLDADFVQLKDYDIIFKKRNLE